MQYFRQHGQATNCCDDVIKWKHFPRYWPFVRGIHRWLVTPPPPPHTHTHTHKGQWRGALIFLWFETTSRSLWSHSNDFVSLYRALYHSLFIPTLYVIRRVCAALEHLRLQHVFRCMVKQSGAHLLRGPVFLNPKLDNMSPCDVSEFDWCCEYRVVIGFSTTAMVFFKIFPDHNITTCIK